MFRRCEVCLEAEVNSSRLFYEMGKLNFRRKPDSKFPADVDFISDGDLATAPTLVKRLKMRCVYHASTAEII
jgi:hypothetical protein